MPTGPSVDEAVERALRAQDNKITAIRDLATARQTLTDVKTDAARKVAELERQNAERINAAEREDVRLYSAAIKAGWSTEELRKIGFDAPAKARRIASRRATATRSHIQADDTAAGSQENN